MMILISTTLSITTSQWRSEMRLKLAWDDTEWEDIHLPTVKEAGM
jgi:hypothetical protein